MKYILHVFIIVTLLGCKNNKDKENIPQPVIENPCSNKTYALTNNSSKSWNITDNYPKDTLETCNYPSEHSVDNRWTFNADGTFTFDPGQIVGNNPGAGCSDPIYFAAKWEFIGEDRFVLIFDRPIDMGGATKESRDTLTIRAFTCDRFELGLASNGKSLTSVFTPI